MCSDRQLFYVLAQSLLTFRSVYYGRFMPELAKKRTEQVIDRNLRIEAEIWIKREERPEEREPPISCDPILQRPQQHRLAASCRPGQQYQADFLIESSL